MTVIFFFQSSGKYRVYSANTHRSHMVNILFPRCKFPSVKYLVIVSEENCVVNLRVTYLRCGGCRYWHCFTGQDAIRLLILLTVHLLRHHWLLVRILLRYGLTHSLYQGQRLDKVNVWIKLWWLLHHHIQSIRNWLYVELNWISVNNYPWRKFQVKM